MAIIAAMADVSVIVPAHNEERYLERALRSLLLQTDPPERYDVIVVDDGSTDATLRVAERFPNVQVIQNERRRGLPAAINVGIRAANTRFIVRVDADDYVHQDFVRILRLFLELNPYMEAVACDYLLVDEHEQHLEHVNALERPIGCGIMFRKDRLVEIGLYDEAFLMAEDVDLRLRFERSWPVHRCELPLYRYRSHPESMTTDGETHDTHRARAYAKHADAVVDP